MNTDIAEHIYLIAKTGAISCGHCKQQFQVSYPCSEERLVAYIEAFSSMHFDCKKVEHE